MQRLTEHTQEVGGNTHVVLCIGHFLKANQAEIRNGLCFFYSLFSTPNNQSYIGKNKKENKESTSESVKRNVYALSGTSQHSR